MIVGYCRVSTSSQELSLQLDALNKAGCERIFSDVISGSKESRPELDKCLSFLQRGDTLVIWKLDRLGRSLRHLVNVVHDLDQRGIAFRALTGDLNTATASGRLLFGIFAALAEFERELIRERVNAGLAAAKSRGVRFGPRIKCTEEIIAQAAAQLKAGHSRVQIGKNLGLSKSTMYRALPQ